MKLRLAVKIPENQAIYPSEPRSYGTGFRFCGCKGSVFLLFFFHFFEVRVYRSVPPHPTRLIIAEWRRSTVWYTPFRGSRKYRRLGLFLLFRRGS